MGRNSGQFTLTPNTDKLVHLYVHNNYKNASRVTDCESKFNCCAISTRDYEPIVYKYNSTVDSCGIKNSNFGSSRYFRIKIEKPGNFSPQIVLETSGTLNTSQLAMKDCSLNNAQSIQCDISYGWFFPEIGKDNVVIITAQNGSLPNERDFDTVLSYKSEEWLGADMFLFLSLLILVLIVINMILYGKKILARCQCGNCGRWTWNKVVNGCHFLAGVEKELEQELERDFHNGIQDEN